jgi:hypothetical protein
MTTTIVLTGDEDAALLGDVPRSDKSSTKPPLWGCAHPPTRTAWRAPRRPLELTPARERTWPCTAFDDDVLGQPSLGIDALCSWPSVLLFWPLFPLHLLIGLLAGFVPPLGRCVVSAQISYCQSGVGGGPERRNGFLVPCMIWALFASIVNMFVKSAGKRFRLWDLLMALQAGGDAGWFFFYGAPACARCARTAPELASPHRAHPPRGSEQLA